MHSLGKLLLAFVLLHFVFQGQMCLLLQVSLDFLLLHSSPLWKTQQWPQDWKRSIFTLIPKKGNAKEISNYCIIALFSHACKVMLKILQTRLQLYVNQELPDVQAGFRKGRGTRNQIAIIWIIEKKIFPFYFCFIDYATAFDCVDHNKLWTIPKEVGIQTLLPASYKTCMQVKKQQLEWIWNNGLVPN